MAWPFFTEERPGCATPVQLLDAPQAGRVVQAMRPLWSPSPALAVGVDMAPARLIHITWVDMETPGHLQEDSQGL